ncbi:hypothetical protein BDN71DRAFT_1508111 [Pleurotus eryngii]|uniref:Fungal-type protein kinase domain-containing protein n=1 Tax=Pleurotus eryngii TaxID=5323 RepID=A0A9P6D7B2_PLEER|nr:hypothetical protein BDN71DRAFT_1508111 [Pleurotus eryngii]
MSDSYGSEAARSDAFDRIVKPLFSRWNNQEEIRPKIELTSAMVDRVLTYGWIVVLREDKNEGGTGSDVYMQHSRDFDLFHKTENVVVGASAFLVGVWGSVNEAPERVFIKLVDKRPYGAEVHHYLAEHGCAPKLYGRKILSGAPIVYRDILSTTSPMGIKDSVNRTLEVLESGGWVHGDLNIMIRLCDEGKPEDTLKIMIVDFDWAGKVGTVKYPLTRNEEIAWPGPRGDDIKQGDGKCLFNLWWNPFSTSIPS